MKALTAEQVASYRLDGFLFPIPALTEDELAQARAGLDRLERWLQSPLTKAEGKWRSSAYTFLPWANRLARHPRILDVVEDVLGPDILVYTSTFFIKEPGTPAFAAWHQDSTYFGLQPFEHVTAWVALSEASALAGCMDVLSAHGKPRQMHHAALRLTDSINGGGQSIVEPIDGTDAVSMQLRAGEFSLHHTLCAHRSAPNRSDHRRIGFGISYIPAHARSTGSYRMTALQVRGRDHGNFDLLPDPLAEFDPAALEVHDRAYKRYRENYREQERLHEQTFGTPSAEDLKAPRTHALNPIHPSHPP